MGGFHLASSLDEDMQVIKAGLAHTGSLIPLLLR